MNEKIHSHFKMIDYCSAISGYQDTITHEQFGSIGSFKSGTVAWLLTVLSLQVRIYRLVIIRFANMANKVQCKNIFLVV